MRRAALPLAWLLAAVLTATAHAQPPRAAEEAPPPLERAGHVPTPDGDLYYETYGHGPAVILLAGGPGAAHTSLRPEFDRLARTHTVVYVDNIGRGRSSDLPAGRHHSPQRDAEDVERLRQALGLERFVLIGHSYGGRPAMVYATLHPERLTHLVLSSSGHSHESSQRNIDTVNRFVERQFPEVWAQLLELRASGVTTCDPRYQRLYGGPVARLYWRDPDNATVRPQVSTDPRDRFRLNVYCDMLGDDAELRVGNAMAGFDIRPALRAVRVRTLITAGRFDPICPPREAHEIARAFAPGWATLRIFEHSAHRPWVEEGERYFSELAAFLDMPAGL